MTSTFAAPPSGKKLRIPSSERITTHSDLSGMFIVKHARKSTPNPKNPGKSVEDQFSVIDERTAYLNMVELARVDEDKQGATMHARNLSRAKLEQTMSLIREHRVAVVAFYKLNRGFRRQSIWGQFKELCYERNTLIWASGRLYDMSVSADNSALSFEAVMDEQAAASAREDSLRGIRFAAAAGKPHGRLRYGYQRVYDGSGRLISIEFNPHQVAVLKEIARRVLEDKEGVTAVGRDLQRRQLEWLAGDRKDPVAGGVVRLAQGEWDAKEVRETLLDRPYYGLRVHTVKETGDESVTAAMWPAIYPTEQSATAVAHFKASGHGERDTTAKHPLTGLLVCTRCEKGMYYNASGPNDPRYACIRCGRNRNAVKIEEFVFAYMEQWLADTKAREAEFKVDRDPAAKARQAELAAYRAELAELDADLESGEIVAKAYSIRLRVLEPLIQRLEAQLAAADVGSTAWDEYIDAGSPKLSDMSIERRRITIAAFYRFRVDASKRGNKFDYSSIHPTQLD